MLKTEAHRIIDAYKVKGEDTIKHNVLSQAGVQCRAGKWAVPFDDTIYPQFLTQIDKTLSINTTKELYFLEVPNPEYNMIKVDIDLRFKATEDELKQHSNFRRRYTDDFIVLVINIIATNLEDIIKIPESYRIYVQEKQKPRIAHQEKQIKDGIHIIIPELVLSNTALYYLREQLIENEELQQKLKEIGNITGITDVFDKRIIYPNAWYIYGCGKPDDKGDNYCVSKTYKIVKLSKNKVKATKEDTEVDTEVEDEEDGDFSIKLMISNKTRMEYINLFSNYGKIPNVEYKIDFDQDKYCNDNNTKYLGKENEALIRSYAQDQNNFRNSSTLTQDEIKPYLDCLKKKRADDYEDWRRIGICLFNMDHRNYDLWKNWSSQSTKYNEGVCFKAWYKEFPKASKYNLGLNKIRECAKNDNPDKYKQIININKKNFFLRWLQAHMDEKDIHSKTLSISTITKFIYSYIKDYATFNIACALPGGASCVYYKFDKHKWSEDKGANKIYNLLSDTIKNELNEIFLELKDKLIATQRIEHEQNRNRNRSAVNDDDDGASVASYQRFIIDDRETVVNPEQMADDAKAKIYTKLQHEKCAAILQFMDTPRNKKTVIEDLSQKSYDEEFYKKLDENVNIFVCNNGVLDLEQCIFRDGQPSDMMTISSGIEYPKNIDSPEAQDIMFSIQDWLDKIFPDEELQEFTLNEIACKLSGKLFGEKFIICTGSGANGKSQLFKILKEIFGDYFIMSDNTLLNTPKRDANSASPAQASLKSRRIVVMTEPKNNQPFESDKVKELVSGDPFICRHLNKDPIMVTPQYRMFLMCNDIPRNESTDDGFWRKIYIIPMESKFIAKEEDYYKLEDSIKYPNHFKALDQAHLYKDWAPYFLYLLFERFKVLKANDFKFSIPDKVKMATKLYQEEASTYTQFFNDKLEESPGYKVDATSMYEEFVRFVGRDFKTHKPTFLKQMERLIGKPKGKNKDYYGFRIYGTPGELIETTNANTATDGSNTD